MLAALILTVFNGYVSFLLLNQTTNMAVQRATKIFKKRFILLRSSFLCREMMIIEIAIRYCRT